MRTAYVDKKVGERFEFGRYPQGPNGEVKPVTWRALRRVGDSLLVISERALDAKPYNEDWRPITWSECSLRRWLNGEFLEKAFNEGERSLIKTSRLVNNAGPATEDRVFLLSIDEAKSLFADSFDRTVRPADYAVENGVYTNDKGAAWWWLRSRGDSHHSAARVDTSGGVRYFISSAYHSFGSVRPAVRLAL